MSTEMKEHYVTVGNINTHYWSLGEGEPLVFVHGGGAGADAWGNWHSVIPSFAERGYRVFALDMVGFGKTDKPDPNGFEYSQKSRMEHLAGFLRAMNLGPAHLVGNSMGGSASLGVAIAYPELANKLILLGTAGRGRPSVASKELNNIREFTPSREQMFKMIRGLTYKEFEIKDSLIEYRLNLIQMPGAMEAYSAAMNLNRTKGMYFEDAELEQVQHKTLLIHGKNDKVLPKEYSIEMANIMPNSWLHVIPNCGHWVMVEYPQEFVQTSLQFLEHA